MKRLLILSAALMLLSVIAAPAFAQVPPEACYGDQQVDAQNPDCGGVGSEPVDRPAQPPSRGATSPQTAAQPQLAETGISLSVGTVTAVVLLGAGFALLLGTRRRADADS